MDAKNIEYLYFKNPCLVVTANGRQKVDCATVIFKNEGTTIATIDGAWTLPPGASFSLDAPPLSSVVIAGVVHWVVSQNVHEYQITFSGGQGQLVIIQQIYQDR